MSKQLNIRGEHGDEFRNYSGRTWPLGTRMHLADGRVFRYALAGTSALVVARVMQAARQDEALVDAPVVFPRLGPRDFSISLRGTSPKSIASRTYEDGLLYVNDGTGEGHVYHVADNSPLTIRSAAAQLTVHLDSDFVTLPDTSTRVTLLRNRYSGLGQADNPPRSAVVGVTPMAVAANLYFWLQTYGSCVVLQQDDLETYMSVAASRVTSGAVELATVMVPSNVLSDRYGDDGVVVERVLGDDGGPAKGRISRRSGIGVVPTLSLGHVLSAREHGQHCLVQLELE